MNEYFVLVQVEYVCTDLADGRNLLEMIAGEKVGRLNSGKMRTIHRVENVNKSVAFPPFPHTKVGILHRITLLIHIITQCNHTTPDTKISSVEF